MKKTLITYFVILLGFVSTISAQTYPVSSSQVMPFPHPVFLSDYYAPTSNSLQVTIKLNDYTIPSLNVKLKIIISDGNIELSTKNNYIPTNTITLIPGLPITLQGSDLYDALNINNMNLSGISAGYLNQNGGKLPEGQYNFCVVVLDATYNKEISMQSCSAAFLESQQPPTIISPENAAYIKPSNPQTVQFNWQVSGGGQPSFGGQNTYKLMLYEVTVANEDPRNSVINSQATQVYESQPSTVTNFNLDFSTALLTAGKQYVFRIQGIGPDGKNVFENDGYSEWRYFNYGYPTGGKIELDKPYDGKQFKKTDQKVFSWGVSDKGTDNQKYAYKIIIVPQDDTTKTYEETFLNGTPFHEETLAEVSSQDGSNFLLNQELTPDTKYIWKIEAYSDGQKVAESDPQSFYSHSLIDNFYASNREIEVIQITKPDLDDLAGKARIHLSNDEQDFVDVNFSNIKIKEVAGQMIMTDGEIIFDLSGRDPMELEPEIENNGNAFFDYVSGKIDKNGLAFIGKMRWKIPHAVMPGEDDEVLTTPSTFTMNSEGKLSGEAGIEPFSTVLADPQGFKLKLKQTSLLQLSNNKFKINVAGEITLPESIKSLDGQAIKFIFSDYVNQLDYIHIDNLIGKVSAGIAPFNNFKMEFIPLSGGYMDLSEDKSPEKLSADKSWKGLYVTGYKIRLHATDLDASNQLSIESLIDHNETTDGTSNKFWISGNGLTLKTDVNLVEDEGVKFNTFPAKTIGTIEFKKGSLKKAIFEGTIQIPFVGDDEKFKFEINATVEGLEEGFLNEDLTKRNLVFNPFGVENKMKIKINRAVFENNEWISMNLDVEIPEVGATIESIEDFRVYGDNFVGVSGKNKAKTLDDFVKGKFKNLDLSITEFGAAYLGGSYAVSYSAETSLSEGFSGKDGPPILAISSVMETSAEPSPDAVIPAPDIEVPKGLENETAVKPAGIDLKIETILIDGDAKLLFTANDPKWGTKFEGGINVKLKLPIAINFGSNMTFGLTKDKMDYWYFDAYFEDKSGVGIPVIEPVTFATTGQIVKLFNVTGMEGKIYRHMRGTQDKDGKFSIDLAPDVMFGVALYAQAIDNYAKGFIFQADVGIEAEIKGKGFKLESMKMSMSGKVSFLNFNVRTGVNTKQIVADVAAAAAEEGVDLLAGAIFPIKFDINNTKYKINSTGFDNGSLSIGNYDGGDGFKIGGNVSSKPSADIGFAKDGFKFGAQGDASGSGKFDFNVPGVKLNATMDKMNAGTFDLKLNDLKLDFGADIAKKKGDFGFDYNGTKLTLNVDAPNKKGLIDVAVSDVKFHASTNLPDKKASIGFDINNNKFDMSYNGGDKKANLLADIAGVELKTSLDLNKKEGKLYLETSSEKIYVLGSEKEAAFKLEKGSTLVDFKSNFAKETGSVNLKFPNNQLKGDIAQDKASIFMKQNDFEIGLKGKYDGTSGDIHLKQGDFIFDLGANITAEKGYLSLTKGSTTFSSKYNPKDSSYVRYKNSTLLGEVGVYKNTYKTHFKNSSTEMLLQANPTKKSGRMLFSIPSFGFDGSFNATAKNARINIRQGDVYLKNYLSKDSAVINYTIGNKNYRVAGIPDGSGYVYYKDGGAGVATGFGYNKKDKAGSLLFQKGDLLINIAANNKKKKGKVILEKGNDKFHAIIADSSYIMTKLEGVTFAAVKKTSKTSVFFGDDNNQIGLSKLQNGGEVFLKAGNSKINLSKNASIYKAKYVEGSLSISSELSPTLTKIDFTKNSMAISTSVNTSSAFNFKYSDGSNSSNIGGNIETGKYNFAIKADGWSGNLQEKIKAKSTEINLSKSSANLGLKYMTSTKSILLGIGDFSISGGILQGSAFLNSNYKNIAFKANQSSGVSLETGIAKATFTNITSKKFDLGLSFDSHNIVVKQIPINGDLSLDVAIDGNPISANPDAFSFNVNAAGWTGNVATAFKKKSANISISNGDISLAMAYDDKNQYLSFGKGQDVIAGGVKKGNAFFKTVYNGFSAELDNTNMAFKTNAANLTLSNFQNNMFDMEMKIGSKKIFLNPSLDNGNYKLAGSIDNSGFEIGSKNLSVAIDESGYQGTFASSLIDGTNNLNITKGDITIESELSASNKTLKLSYNGIEVSGGKKNSTSFFSAGFQNLKAEVNSNGVVFNFDGSSIEVKNIANNKFDLEFLIGSKNFVLKQVSTANGLELVSKINGSIINSTTAYDTIIDSKAVHIEKSSAGKYTASISKGDLQFAVNYESNKAPEIGIKKANNTVNIVLTQNDITTDVNGYTANYKPSDKKFLLSKSNNTLAIDDNSLDVVIGKTKVNVTEQAVSFEKGNLKVNGTNDLIGLENTFGSKVLNVTAKKTGEITAKASNNDISIEANYVAGQQPEIDIDKAGAVYEYVFTDDEINLSTNDYTAKYNKLDHILELNQGTSNQFKVSEDLLGLKVADIDFEATPNSFSLDKGDLSTFIDNNIVRVKHKFGNKQFKVEIANDGASNVSMASGDLTFNTAYVANEIPEVTVKKGSNEFGYRISDAAVTVFKNEYEATYTKGDNKINIKQGNDNSFSLSPTNITTSIAGYSISAGTDSLAVENNDIKTSISANKVAIKVDGKVLEIKKDKSIKLAIASDKSINASSKALELVYGSNKLKVNKTTLSVAEASQQISGSITSDGAVLQKGDYKLTAKTTNLNFEHGGDNLKIKDGTISGKFDKSIFSISKNNAISYKDDARELGVSAQSLTLMYDGIGLAVLPNKVKIGMGDAGSIIASKDLLSYTNKDLMVALKKPMQTPIFNFAYKDKTLKLASTEVAIGVGEKKLTAGKNKLIVQIDKEHILGYNNKTLSLKYTKYTASFVNYSKLKLSDGVREFVVSSKELQAKLDSKNSLRAYLENGKPGLTLKIDGNPINVSTKGASFSVAGYDFTLSPTNYVKMQKKGETGSDGLYVNKTGLQYKSDGNKLQLGTGEKIIELVYQNDKSLTFTKNKSLIFSIGSGNKTTIDKNLAVTFQNGDNIVELNKPDYMVGYRNTKIGATLKFKKFTEGVGVELSKGDISAYVKGGKDKYITAGMESAKYGGFEFSCDSKKDIKLSGLKGGAHIVDGTLKGGKKLSNLLVQKIDGSKIFEYKDKVDIMGEAVDGVEEVAMDGPAHLSTISAEAFGWATAGVEMSIIASSNPRIVMNGNVKTGLNIPILCAEAPFAASIGKDGFIYQLADSKNKASLKLICAGLDLPPLTGYAKYEVKPGPQTSFNVALGLGFHSKFKGGFSVPMGACKLKVGVSMAAGFDFLGDATMVLPISGGDASFALNAAYVDLYASASVYGKLSNVCGGYELSASAAMHGRLEMKTTDNTTNISGIASGSVKIGPISKSFDIDVNQDI